MKISQLDAPAFCEELFSFSSSGGGLPYYLGADAAAEPTLMALLALHASGVPVERAKPLLMWLLTAQNEDGSVGLNPVHRQQGLWLTAQSVLVFHYYRQKKVHDRAVNFLLSLKSITLPNDRNVRQDNNLVGWPWVPGTFGWVEPTAWAIIALNVAGLAGHPRAVEGRKFLLDRQIPSGGWNYGNSGINDKELLPFFDTTGLALVALYGMDEKWIRSSLDILDKGQDRIESLCGLSWAVLGLESHGRDAGRLKRKLINVLSQTAGAGGNINFAHFAAGLMALSRKKVLIP